jgi:hypothetical protein
MDRGRQDRGERGGGDPAVSVGAQRVRTWRRRRVEAGLVEVKAWVREADLARATALLEPLTDAGMQQLRRHERQGRTNQVAVTLRFPRTPPHAFREGVLRTEWGLCWDRAHGCWHGGVENGAAANELRRMVAPHGGVVEAG